MVVGFFNTSYYFTSKIITSIDTTNSFTTDAYKGTIGLENISKGNNLILKLEERGFSKEDIEKISYKNFINLMDRIL